MEFLLCACYYAALGILFFFVGRLVSRRKLNYEAFPFKCCGFEREGQIYKKIGIHRWQNLLPDMSRIMKKFMPAKKIQGRPSKDELLTMINETCVAELIHVILSVLALGSVFIWPGGGGLILWIIYFVGNFPYIIIQRYNRPRFVKLLKHCRE